MSKTRNYIPKLKSERIYKIYVDFITKATKKHGGKYDYSKVEYINSHELVKIICPIHGEFEQTPCNHIRAYGCINCYNESLKYDENTFINNCRIIYWDKYNYSKINFINNKTDVEITCVKHNNIFNIKPIEHLDGMKGCSECYDELRVVFLKEYEYKPNDIEFDYGDSTLNYIAKCQKKHGNKYDYSKTKYIGTHEKVYIICSIHGGFWQLATNHLQGQGCPDCVDKTKQTTTCNNELFKDKAILKHGNKYDYSNIEYKNARSILEIKCNLHNDIFFQSANNHLNGQGCPKCFGNILKTNEQFINEAIEIHDDKFNYDRVEYMNSNTNVKIYCKIHDYLFDQTPANHLTSIHACPICTGLKQKDNEQFIKEANVIHCNKYDYSLVEYLNSNTNVIIICKVHGSFSQNPITHTIGMSGCPSCKNSKGENEIYKYLKINNIKFESQYKFKDCINIRPLPFDFYLNDHNILIEFDGIQHFKPIERYGGQKAFDNNLKKDIIKNEYCRINNIKLIRIDYTQIKNIKDILDSYKLFEK